MEPALGQPNGKQDRLCSTAEFVTKQINSRFTERTNFWRGFDEVLENIRHVVFNTHSLVTDCKIKDAKEKKCISVAEILRNVYEFGKQDIDIIKIMKEEAWAKVSHHLERVLCSSMVIYVSLASERFKIGCTCCSKTVPFT